MGRQGVGGEWRARGTPWQLCWRARVGGDNLQELPPQSQCLLAFSLRTHLPSFRRRLPKTHSCPCAESSSVCMLDKMSCTGCNREKLHGFFENAALKSSVFYLPSSYCSLTLRFTVEINSCKLCVRSSSTEHICPNRALAVFGFPDVPGACCSDPASVRDF